MEPIPILSPGIHEMFPSSNFLKRFASKITASGDDSFLERQVLSRFLNGVVAINIIALFPTPFIDLAAATLFRTAALLTARKIQLLNELDQLFEPSFQNLATIPFHFASLCLHPESAPNFPNSFSLSSIDEVSLPQTLEDDTGYLSKYVNVYTRAIAHHLGSGNFPLIIEHGLSRIVSLSSIPIVALTRIADVAFAALSLIFTAFTHILAQLIPIQMVKDLDTKCTTISFAGLQALGMIVKDTLDRIEDAIYLSPKIGAH